MHRDGNHARGSGDGNVTVGPRDGAQVQVRNVCGGRESAIRLREFGNRGLCGGRQRECFGNLSALRVILILRNRDSSQDTDDRDHDHQFDQRETLLYPLDSHPCFFHEIDPL
ncbi:hypothetical protein D3C87_1936420 [compost metagenome]